MRHAVIQALVLACILSSARFASADERFLPGHSRHGEAFDAGPRQDAYIMGGTGKVVFPVSSKKPMVREFIEQGIGQLHGFWFVEAERSFRKVASIDPDYGIAYWGMAVANQTLHPGRAKQFAADAAKHKAGLTDRECMYIDALGNETGYQAIIAKYPQDLEAKAFEVWRVFHKSEETKLYKSEFDAAVALAEKILKVEPMHPIHHALIHIAASTNSENRALESAAKCGDTSPSIGHMWHMPTHIYFALQRFPEAAWQLEASIRTEHARMIHDRVLPDQVHLYAHNNEWLVRTLLYLGRANDARRTARQMIDLPRHPLFNLIEQPIALNNAEKQATADKDEDGLESDEKVVEVHGTSAYYGRDRLLQTLRQYEYWDDLIDACRTGYIEPTATPGEQGKYHMNLAVAYYCRGKPGDLAAGDQELVQVRKLLDEQAGSRQAAIEEARKGPEKDRKKAIGFADARYTINTTSLVRSLAELESYQRIVEGLFISRKMLFVYLTVLVLGEIAVFWFLRRRLVLAILTVVGAVVAGIWLFQRHLALMDLPYDSKNVEFAFMSRKQLEAGDPDVAEWCARQYALNRPNQVRPQANLVEILYGIGKVDEARAEFETLRFMGGVADLDAPPFVRLAPIAREFGLPTDWRRPEKINKMLAGRRPLPSLGPLLWRPWTAPDWKLKDAQGKEHSLAEFHGKPVLMIFFLGQGCLHCKQQLEAFVKKAKQIEETGMSVVAVSTDDEKGVKKSLNDYGSNKFPFLMLADPKLDVFQSYRAYDNFEQIALHGTFVIDVNRFVRWHDEGSEPFMDVNFVLAESKRLLPRPVPPVEPGARVIVDDASRVLPLAASQSR
jgi:peroxiredoxin/tetratricopeptide (TPR) repeat protein